MATFTYTGDNTPIDVVVNSSKFASQPKKGKEKEPAIDLVKAAEGVLDTFEKQGTKTFSTKVSNLSHLMDKKGSKHLVWGIFS